MLDTNNCGMAIGANDNAVANLERALSANADFAVIESAERAVLEMQIGNERDGNAVMVVAASWLRADEAPDMQAVAYAAMARVAEHRGGVGAKMADHYGMPFVPRSMRKVAE